MMMFFIRTCEFSLSALHKIKPNSAGMYRTQCHIYPEFRDSNPFLHDTKIDYAIFHNPPDGSALNLSLHRYRSLDRNNRVSCLQTSDEANTPLAIGIETKNNKANSAIGGPAQLDTLLRSHFRHLDSLPNASSQELPMLPVVFVNGANWRVDFAVRTETNLVCESHHY